MRAPVGFGKIAWILLILLAMGTVLAMPWVSRQFTQNPGVRAGIAGLAGVVLLLALPAARFSHLARPAALSMVVLTSLLGFGTIYRQVILAEEYTFRPQLISSLGFWCSLAISWLAGVAFAKRFFFSLVGFGGLLLIPAILYFFWLKEEAIHEMVYLFVPLGVAIGLRGGPLPFIGGVVYLMIWIIFGMKNTTAIIGGLCLGILFIGTWFRLRHDRQQARMAPLFLFAGGIAFLCAIGGYALIRENLPVSTGNANFRTFLYEKVLNLFYESPLYGSFFTESPVWHFDLFEMEDMGDKNPLLPSHSDVLDILGHGGLLAFVPFLVVAGTMAKRTYDTIRLAALKIGSPQDLYFPLAALAGIIQISFNPVLIQISNGFLLFTLIGLAFADSLTDPRTNERQ